MFIPCLLWHPQDPWGHIIACADVPYDCALFFKYSFGSVRVVHLGRAEVSHEFVNRKTSTVTLKRQWKPLQIMQLRYSHLCSLKILGWYPQGAPSVRYWHGVRGHLCSGLFWPLSNDLFSGKTTNYGREGSLKWQRTGRLKGPPFEKNVGHCFL